MASDGILIKLDALVASRADPPVALDEAPAALRRIGWVGRPIVMVGRRVAGRELPVDASEREAWVRGTLGAGAYAVVALDEPWADPTRTEPDDTRAERWRAAQASLHGTWLVTDDSREIGPARRGGLKVIVIGPADPQPRVHRPDYRARDLRDAVGHLLAEDVFSDTAQVSGGRPYA